MPKRLLKNPAFLVTVASLVFFAAMTQVFKPDELSDATATVMAVACIAGLWRWGPTGWRVFWQGGRRTWDWGILAICLLLIAVIFGRIYGVIYRQLERPDWLTNSYWSPFFLFMLFGAIVLLVAATKEES